MRSTFGRMDENSKLVRKTISMTLVSTVLDVPVWGMVMMSAKGTAPLMSPAPKRMKAQYGCRRQLASPRMAQPIKLGINILMRRPAINATKVKPKRETEKVDFWFPSDSETNVCRLKMQNPRRKKMNPDAPIFSVQIDILVTSLPDQVRLQALKCDITVPQNSIDMTPEHCSSSLSKQLKNPVSRVRAISDIPFSARRNRQCLKIKVVSIPVMNPINSEQDTTYRNYRTNSPIFATSISIFWSLHFCTTFNAESNSVTDIVSLNRASPNMIENSFGYRYLFTTFSETIGSMLHSAADVKSISQLRKTIGQLISETETQRLLQRQRMRQKTMRCRKVPISPQRLMQKIF